MADTATQRFDYIKEFGVFVVRDNGTRFTTVETPQRAGLLVSQVSKLKTLSEIQDFKTKHKS